MTKVEQIKILIKISPEILMKIIYSNNHNNDQTCLVYDHIILNKTYKMISEERNIWVNKIASTIKRFQKNQIWEHMQIDAL